jgi:hypothetical protein
MEIENSNVSLFPLLRLERKLMQLRKSEGYAIARILDENRIIEKRWCNDLHRDMTYIYPVSSKERDLIRELMHPMCFYAPTGKGPRPIYVHSDKENLTHTIK